MKFILPFSLALLVSACASSGDNREAEAITRAGNLYEKCTLDTSRKIDTPTQSPEAVAGRSLELCRSPLLSVMQVILADTRKYDKSAFSDIFIKHLKEGATEVVVADIRQRRATKTGG